MHLEIDAAQRDRLLELINEALDEMGPEIHHTWTRSYKDELKTDRRELRRLRETLAQLAEPMPAVPA